MPTQDDTSVQKKQDDGLDLAFERMMQQLRGEPTGDSTETHFENGQGVINFEENEHRPNQENRCK